MRHDESKHAIKVITNQSILYVEKTYSKLKMHVDFISDTVGGSFCDGEAVLMLFVLRIS